VSNNPNNSIDILGLNAAALAGICRDVAVGASGLPGPGWKAVAAAAAAAAAAVTVMSMDGSSKSDENKEGQSGSGAEGGREATPANAPGAFVPVRGSSAKTNVETGEVWVKDKSGANQAGHGGPHYEVYKNKKDYEKGKRDRAVVMYGRMEDLRGSFSEDSK
jgi:hypothetical protein